MVSRVHSGKRNKPANHISVQSHECCLGQVLKAMEAQRRLMDAEIRGWGGAGVGSIQQEVVLVLRLEGPRKQANEGDR